FFFFQAEDGIRDGHVTGVQTCALPIYRRRIRSLVRAEFAPHRPIEKYKKQQTHRRDGKTRREFLAQPKPKTRAGHPIKERGFFRSEERRVGKEWGSERGKKQQE